MGRQERAFFDRVPKTSRFEILKESLPEIKHCLTNSHALPNLLRIADGSPESYQIHEKPPAQRVLDVGVPKIKS